MPQVPGQPQSDNPYLSMVDSTPQEDQPAPAAAPANPYLTLLDDDKKRRDVRLSAALQPALATTPDQHAANITLARDANLPLGAVETDPKEVEKQVRVNRVLTALQGSPLLQAWYAQDDNAVLAMDDYENLGALETAWRTAKNSLYEFNRQGAYSIGAGISGAGDLLDSAAYGLARASYATRDFVADIGAAAQDIGTMASGMGRFGPTPGPTAAADAQARRVADHRTPADLAAQDMRESREGSASPSNWLRSLGGWVKKGALIGQVAPSLYEELPDNERNIVTDVSGGLAQLIGQAAVTYVNPTTGVALMAGQGADQQAEQADAAGATEGERAAAVAAGGVITAAVEKLGLDLLLDRLPPKIKSQAVRWIVDKGIAAAIEGGEEGIEQVANNIVTSMTYDPDMPLLQGVGDVATVGGGVGLVARALLGIRGGRQTQQNAQGEASALDSVVQAAGKSQLNKLAPERLRGLVRQMAAGGGDTVYIGAEGLKTLFQSQSAEQIAAELGVPAERVSEALLTGSDLPVPTEDYVVNIAPKHHEKLRDVVRFTPGAMTAEEAADVEARSQEAAAQFMASVESAGQSDQRIYDDVYGMLIGTGRFRREDIESYALLTQAWFRTMAARSGQDAMELYAPYGLRIRSEVPKALQRGGVDTVMDPLIDRLRSGDRPKDRRQSLVEFLAAAGGVTDGKLTGELATLAENDRATRQGKPRLVRPDATRDLDRAREAAAKAGYLPMDSDVNDLLALLDQEQSGHPVYAMGDDADPQIAALDALEEELGRRGLDIGAMDNAAVKRALFGEGDTLDMDEAARRVLDQSVVDQTQTPEFKRWFGDSKVVDADGKPLVVYHGTGARVGKRGEFIPADFDTFDGSLSGQSSKTGAPGDSFFFTNDPEVASSYTVAWRGDFSERLREGAQVMPVYLSLRRPLKLSAKGNSWRNIEYKGEVGDINEIVELAKQSGRYDGVIVTRVLDHGVGKTSGKPATTYVAFRPEQIKSATGNSGAFDPANPSILSQRADTIRRGSITFGNDRQFTVDLFKDANASTFLHEMGHFWLEVMGDLAADPNANPQIAADYAAILNWFGVTDRSEITTEHHEQWARGFERYLGEGKAPTVELQGAFSRFKAWLLAIYRNLLNLNTPINDDIRKVMDRMLATDEEITTAETSLDYAPLFADARSAGWSDAEFATRLRLQEQAREESEARLMARAMRDVSRETRKWWNERKEEVRAEVTAETQQNPVYRALSFLQNGTNPDGSLLPEGTLTGKLDKAWLVERYGQEWLNNNLLRKRVYAADGGLNPDTVAAMHGFASGDELVQSLANALPMSEVIKAETQQRMVERYGDILTDGTMPEQAMRAVHGNRRMRAMEADLAALERLAGEPSPSATVMREAAKTIIAGKRVRDVQPNSYLRAERRAAKEAIQSAGRQEWGRALQAQRERLLNAHLYAEAQKARDDLARAERRTKKAAKRPAQERLAKAGGKWRELTNSILAAVGVRPLGEGVQRASVADWIQANVGTQLDRDAATAPLVNPFPLSVETLVDSGQTTALKDLTTQEVRDVLTALRNIDTQASNANKLIREGQRVDKAAALAELSERLESTLPQLGSAFSDAERGLGERLGDTYRAFADTLLNPQTIIERMDGGESGPWHDLLWNLASSSRDARSEMRETTLKPLVELIGKWTPEQHARYLADDVVMESLGGVALKRQTLVSMALNMGTESSLDKLMRGGRYLPDGRHVKFDQPVIDEVIQNLSREDWELVQTVWEVTKSLWEPTAALQRKLGGIMPDKLKTRMIDTPFGAIQGEYFPLVADRSQSRIGQKQAVTDTVKQMTAGIGRASTSKARLKERTGVAYPLELDLERLLVRHIDETITDITHREWLIQANQVLDDPALAAVLKNRIGVTAAHALKGMVARSVNDRNYGDPAMSGPNKLMDAAILNLSSMALGFRVLLGGANYVSAWAQAGARVSPKRMVAAFGKTAGPKAFKEGEAFVYELSPYMRNRAGDFDKTLRDALDGLAGKQTFRKKMIRMGLAYQSYADRLAVVPIWIARFEEARAEGSSIAEATRLADTAIQQTQTDNSAIGLSAFEGERGYRLFKLFIGPMIIQGNRIRDAVGKVGASAEQTMPERMGVLMASWVLPALIFDLMMGRWPDDGDDEERDAGDWLGWAATKIAMYPAATVPFLRDVASTLEAKIEGKPVFAKGNPIGDASQALAMAGWQASNETLDAAQGEDVDGEKLFNAWLKAAGATYGVPAQAITPPTQFIYDVGTGDYQPESPADLRYLLIRRDDRR